MLVSNSILGELLKRNPKARNEHFIEEKRNVPYNYRKGIPMPLPSLDKGDVPVYGICLYMFQIIY